VTIGDFDPSAVVYFKFTTQRPSTGAPFTLAGTPALSVYKDNSVTQSTTGVTLTADFDSVTGLNHVAIDTSADGTFYAAGSFFDVVITTGTVDSVSAVGFVVGRFSLRKTAGLKPATAGRMLVVDAAGLADANMVKAGPTGSGTAQTARDLGASVLLSAGTGTGQLDFASGVVKSNLSQILGTALTETAGQLAAAFKKFFNIATPASTMDSLTLVATATNLTNAPTAGDLTATMKASVTTAATAATPTAAAVTGAVGSVTGAVGSVTGNVGGNVVGSVASVTAGVTVTTNNDKTGYAMTAAYDLAKTAAQDGDAMTLTIAYDAAKTAASQTSVNTLQSTADKLETTLQDSGASPTAYQFTTPALANGPSGSGPSVTAIVNGVWDEPTSGHQTTGTTGKALTSAGSAGDPWSSVLGSGLLTAGDMMLILVAVAAGKTTVVPLSAGSATVTFRDLADTKDSVAATMSGSQRVSVVLNP